MFLFANSFSFFLNVAKQNEAASNASTERASDKGRLHSIGSDSKPVDQFTTKWIVDYMRTYANAIRRERKVEKDFFSSKSKLVYLYPEYTFNSILLKNNVHRIATADEVIIKIHQKRI